MISWGEIGLVVMSRGLEFLFKFLRLRVLLL